ncbi:hypothetical protein [Hufsiella ginkgonis]|uniref:Beta-1,6-galactofuranosyltransferase n=1 Tax=Hufsiella ginkgonis TaxID=2695274 RepID=A0A7K1Y0H8_9SPHI|nr:hypothetical protein [Hufsiella ginkgonis]MXV16702.1 hypothetical protein [Hufsiella ginkgonis]
MKYQFCIRFKDIDVNSAASKAVLDCNRIFSECGYQDYTLTVNDNSGKLKYYLFLLRQLSVFFFSIKRKSIVSIQYPLLSINAVFKYFIKATRLKRVRFFCIVHDLESLRSGGTDDKLIAEEVRNLNCYDTLIVHNEHMINWLTVHGVTVKMISLKLFDYLSADFISNGRADAAGSIVFAGNLAKSRFIYSLPQVKNKQFDLYGPGFLPDGSQVNKNLAWKGLYGPEQIQKELMGSFGLIWDGTHIDRCDEILGNYLLYNNPHKCSLYIAAGLPVIAPKSSAIGSFIKREDIGVLVDSLHELESLTIDDDRYHTMKRNVLRIRSKVITGGFFSDALKSIENDYALPG